MRLSLLVSVLLSGISLSAAAVLSHPPMRPLPVASARPLPPGPVRHVDGAKGSDAGDGSPARPWKTVTHAVSQLQPGHTLVLRGGVYHEHVTMELKGTAEQPITLRSHPAELAILDGGVPEFLLNPAAAWEPVREGAPHEFRSVRKFPHPGKPKDSTRALGNFADSMLPLHGARFLSDLRATNEYFEAFQGDKTVRGSGIYCGPGVFHDESGHLHVRLAHTHQTCLGADNYAGETDPRKVPLVLALADSGPALTLTNCAWVRLEDLAVRGARDATIDLQDSLNVTLDGVTSFGGSAALRVMNTTGLRAVDCAFRGIAAPWTWRGSLKYRSIEARIVAASSWIPQFPGNRDFEFARCEFTDCVDGVFVGNVDGVKIHHSLLDNVSDDGIFVTFRTAHDGTTPGGEIHVYQNLLARCLTTFAFGVGHGRQKVFPDRTATGPGVYIARNVFDFRRPVHYQQPKEGEREIATFGRITGDHGSPAWEPLFIHHNTVLAKDAPWRGYYGQESTKGLGQGARRRVFNNIFLQYQGRPGEVLPSPQTDFVADGNLHWSVGEGAGIGPDFLRRFRNGKDFTASRAAYAPGWTAADLYADPELMQTPEDWRTPADVRPGKGSLVKDRGVSVPVAWPDPIRSRDAGAPDVGAMPVGADGWRVGVRGRLSPFGGECLATPFELTAKLSPHATAPAKPLAEPPSAFAHKNWNGPTGQTVALVEGYPAFDAPLLEYALNAAGSRVDRFEKRWLPVAEYRRYRVVIHTGNLRRAQADQFAFADAELPPLQAWLEGGGTLFLMRASQDIFATDAGRELQTTITGVSRLKRFSKTFPVGLALPDHPWLKGAVAGEVPAWLTRPANVPLPIARGANLIGAPDGRSLLCEIPVGKGRLVYFGWEVASSLPNGRAKTPAEAELVYEEQYRILERVVRGLAR